MKRTLSTLLVVGIAALSLTFAIPMMANATPHNGPAGYYVKVKGGNLGKIQYFPNGHPTGKSEWEFVEGGSPSGCSTCDDAVADATAEAGVGFPAVTDVKVMGYAQAGGKDLIITASADATGKDRYFLWWKIQDGFASAEADINVMEVDVRALVFSNGERHNGGTSFTAVLSIGTLEFNASATAEGNFGCLQMASAALSGEFGAKAGGYARSAVDSIPGAFSYTEGKGSTVVGVSAFDAEVDRYDFKWWIFPTDVTATAEIDGKVIVMQGLLVKAYTSPDGTTTRNFGLITGGSALAFGDANLTSIRADGFVAQEAQAVGNGGYAYGNSQAAYTGAGGNVNNGCISSGHANGLAVVTGYNNVTNTGSHLSVTSHQSAFATTGGGL